MFVTFNMFWNFIFDPDLTTSVRQRIWDMDFRVLFRVLILCIVLSGLAGFVSQILVHQHLIPDPGPTRLERNDMSQFQFVMGAVLLAPFVEELVFRAQLKRFSGMLMFVSLMLGVVMSVIANSYWGFLISPVIFVLLFIVYRFTIAGSVTRKFTFWRSIYPLQFHLTAICFALLHLANYEKGIALLPYGILYTLPQLAIGLVLGTTRMFFGLKYSIALHSLYNLFYVMVLFMTQ